ncbi:MAG: hypothetical protein L0Y54_06055 [Sporichthyaceae bacterium]|nr:hypothetical protein [Sporichthyaceae bacterium]
MRRLLTPRWIALHLLALVLAGTCLVLGWWQLQRGQSGNLRSFAYALEWPAFAIFVLFMWGRMIYDELRPAEPASPSAGSESPATEPAGRIARSSDHEEEHDREHDPELAAYNRYLAELDARARRYGR